MDHLRKALLERWDYEQWANERWSQALPHFQNRDRVERVFRHIYGCYSGWAHCVSDWPSDFDGSLDLQRDISLLHSVWRQVIEESDLEAKITLSDGRQLTALNLIQHVMNHGTYHRGHLRGLAEAEGLTDFPETDYVGYAFSVLSQK